MPSFPAEAPPFLEAYDCPSKATFPRRRFDGGGSIMPRLFELKPLSFEARWRRETG